MIDQENVANVEMETKDINCPYCKGPIRIAMPIRFTPIAALRDNKQESNIDAARYRFLRNRDLETITQGGVFAGMTPDNYILNGEDLDQAVDVAMQQPQRMKE